MLMFHCLLNEEIIKKNVCLHTSHQDFKKRQYDSGTFYTEIK